MKNTSFKKIKEQLINYKNLLSELKKIITSGEEEKIESLLNDIRNQFNEINKIDLQKIKLNEKEIEEIKELEEIIINEMSSIKEKLNNNLTLINNELNSITITKSILQNYYKFKNVSSRFIDQKR
ncbi:MAG TPA: hypothetical protein PLD27_00315 [bacterium]|nr:hypothetical protein [bacterium]HOL48704.1 hypothetical protein [bacterium]HPQ18128.1 hypothetical protein [bacterium]